MREILFRGKRLDNGKWVQGFLVIWGNDYYIAPDINAYTSMGGRGKGRCMMFGHYYQVLTETVGQYTGLTDKNGKKIFEGNVIRVKYSLRLPAGFGNSIRTVTHGIDFIATVIFDKCRFCLEKANGEVCEMPLDSEAVEVIDNIYDNPELLEVTE